MTACGEITTKQSSLRVIEKESGIKDSEIYVGTVINV